MLPFTFLPSSRALGGLLVLFTTATAARGQVVDRPTGFPLVCATNEVQVTLLGVYHFANPGRDVIKQTVDDVLAPQRQAQLDSLVTRLASWRPDRIAVEWPWSLADSTQARYEGYRAGRLAPSRNEVVQIGFRLAARLGHAAVYPIDDDSFLDLNDSLRAVDQTPIRIRTHPRQHRGDPAGECGLEQRVAAPDHQRGSHILDEAPQFCPVSPLPLLR